MNLKLQNNEQLSVTAANGLAGVFINGVSLSTYLSSIDTGNKVFIDDRISGIVEQTDLSIVHLSSTDYAQLCADGQLLSNALYIVDGSYTDNYGKQIKNVADPTLRNDAATKGYVDDAVSSIHIPTDLSAFTNSPGYLISNDVKISYSNQKIWLSSKAYVTSVDCADFIKDGMLSTVELCGTQLVLTFNTDASSAPISVELSNFVDNYDSKIETLSDAIDKKIFIQNSISSISGYSDLSIIKLSADEYAQMLEDGTCLSNAIYIVEAPNIDAFKQRITNVASPTDLSDAANKEYVDNSISNIQIPTDLSDFTNSPGYTTNVGTITGITMNGASKGTSGNVDLGTVLTAHQSLSNCLQNNSSYDSINLTALNGIRLASDVRIDNGYGFTVKDDVQDSYTTVDLTGIGVKEQNAGDVDDQTNIGAAYITMSTLRQMQLPPSELFKSIIFTTKTDNTSQTSSLANLIYTKSETSSATQISSALSTKSAVSFNRITTSGTNIGSITIDGTMTQIYAPAGGGSNVQVSADYSTGTRVATISVDNVPTSIYVPNSSGGSNRYALETAQLIADSGSLTCAVNDQAITTIQVSSSATPVVVQLPAQPTDGARDFILRIEISSSAAPTFTFNGINETIDFDSEDDDWAVLEPGLNIVSFTETKRGSSTNSGGSTPTYCTVTFDIENGTNAYSWQPNFVNPSDATRQVEAGQPVGELPELNQNAMTGFRYWGTTSSTSTAEQVTSSTIITSDVIFYALFNRASG